MPQVIASTYEILQEIGAGGGGVVYLGRHTRLNKMIVLKADKRSLSKNPEALRREVDALKNLSHTYIPQVYDFVQEDGIVYTVMDYIEGESLDKPLKRGERFPQPKLIEWSCELLEALSYLHSRPPYGILHSDIKPANIMVTPQGDIRLIDFNIALALGEEGAVRVGRSRGYASPEHYGLDFSEPPDKISHTNRLTERPNQSGTVSAQSNSFSFRATSTGTSGSKTVLLDKRSDIYSVGATLYHLFTGLRPAQNAAEVKPITEFPINPAIARIIRKAMEPNPDRRYQSADEMLRDFERLHENDPRSKRHRRHIREAAAAVLLVALIGVAMTFIGAQQRERLNFLYRSADASREALREGDVQQAVASALDALPEHPGLYDPPEYIAPAQLALTNALGVYRLEGTYQPWKKIALASEPVKIRMSPDGAKVAALIRDGSVWKIQAFDLESGGNIAEVESEAGSQAEFAFSDNETLLYAGAGGLSAWDFSSGTLRWNTGQPATALALSPGGTLVATVWKEEPQYARLFDVATGAEAHSPVSFEGHSMRFAASDMTGDVQLRLFALDEAGHRMAASFSDGSVTIFDLWDSNETVSLPPSEYTHFEGCFCGHYLGLSRFQTETDNTRFDILNLDSGNPIIALDGSESGKPTFYRVQADATSFYVSDLKHILQVNLAETWSKRLVNMEDEPESIAGFYHAGDRLLLWTRDENRASNEYRVFNAYQQLLDSGTSGSEESYIDRAMIGGAFLAAGNNDKAELMVKKFDNHEDALCFTYDPSYDHQEARLRGDRDAVTLFGYSGFRMVTKDGTILNEVEWDLNSTHDPQYRRPGDTDFLGRPVTEELLEMRFRDGSVEAYSASTGQFLYREQGEAVDTSQSLNTFLTRDYKIVSVNHGAPQIYSAATGELLKTLDNVTFLMYATQVGDCLILQYTAGGTQEEISLGLMLDKNLETIAELPEISDILPDGTLIFDDMLGNLRYSPIYSIQDLMSMAKG